jgi:hypothetical protein
MATAVHKFSARARTGQSASRVLFVAAIFAALLSSAAMVGYKLITPEKPISPDRYRGVVQLGPDERGECPRFEFDNRTGRMRRQNETWCDETAVRPDRAASPGPFSGVRDYFRSH